MPNFSKSSGLSSARLRRHFELDSKAISYVPAGPVAGDDRSVLSSCQEAILWQRGVGISKRIQVLQELIVHLKMLFKTCFDRRRIGQEDFGWIEAAFVEYQTTQPPH